MTDKYIFLSHSSVDKPQVEQLAYRLKDLGFNVWLDKWSLIPGDPWQEEIEKALEECNCCLVLIGKEGSVGPWQNVEMRSAIDYQVTKRSLRVIPVLLPNSSRGDPSRLPAFLRRTTWVEFRFSLDEPENFQRLVCGIRGEKPLIKTKSNTSANPYRGLDVFDIQHTRFFFGRSAVVEWLINSIRPNDLLSSKTHFNDNRFLAIIGASGSGKSSLARAGLLAALRQGVLPNSQNWPQIIFKPGEKPLQSLALAIVSHENFQESHQYPLSQVIESFFKSSLTLHYLSLEWLKGDRQRRIVVLIDQFEEIFTMCQSDSERKLFLDNILNAAFEATGQVLVILTIRADFYPNLTNYEELSRAIERHQYLINPMSKIELTECIEMPAQLVGCQVEPLVIEDLIKDSMKQPGSLPFMQYALTQLWEQRSEQQQLLLREYRKFGGITGAVEQQANKIYKYLTLEQQKECRLIFRRLVQVSESAPNTRRRAQIDEFSGSQKMILRLLIDERLLTTHREADKELVEISHEALLDGWGLLSEWISSEKELIHIQNQMASAAHLWESNSQHSDWLLMGARLNLILDFLDKGLQINSTEQNFLEQSVFIRDQKIMEENNRKEKELVQAKELAEKNKKISESRHKIIKRTNIFLSI